jgi:hypothetical protein
MLNLDTNEIDIVRRWAEHGIGSPFPQEQNLLNRLKRAGTASSFHCSKMEVDVIKFWAEKETAGKYGQSQYLLELEYQLMEKIDTYLEQFDR